MSPAPAFAASRLVNPPGVTPTLSVAQVWAGLDIKARKPQTFVPTITACELVKDEGNKVRSFRSLGSIGGGELEGS